ncbi:MAG: multiubiquitin domain-containing protein [Firmicutes bacterium]|nr:multiubiquitin domain-containing protein [Bacillota bacterium]
MSAEYHSNEHSGKKFFVNIEGTEYPWDKETINTQEIRTLGNLPADMPVIEEDPDGNERTLAEDETITLKPGHRLGRAAKYRRG